MSLLIHFCTLRKCLVLVLQCHLKHFDYRSYNFTMSEMICFCTTLQTCFLFFFRLCWTRESILCQPLVATTGSAARALWYCWSYIHLHCAVLHIPDIISFLKCFEQCTTHRSALWEHRGIYWRSLVLPPHRGNTVACEREHIPLKRRGTPRTVKLFTVDRLVLQRRVVINATHLS